MTHLANWETTLDLFETEYQLPFLPPGPAAYMGWPTHIQWAAMLLVLLCRGPGMLSLDWLIQRRLLGENQQ